MRVPIVELTIAAPPTTVWRALRDPTLIRRWHGWEHEGLTAEIDAVYISGVRAREADGVLEFVGLDHRFLVTPAGDGTRLVVDKPAPEEVESDDDAPYDEIEQGWITFVQQLRYVLERHPGEERATVMLRVGGGAPLTPDAVGLDGGGGLEEWFRTPHQVGLLVGDDALLVLVAHPGGGGRLVLSAYGPGRGALEELGSRWATVLGERYADVAEN